MGRGTQPRAGRHTREIAWLLHHSYPAVSLPVLSARLREAGYPLGGGDLRAHEAIAATQAAIWHLTNGVDLDTRPRSLPTHATAGHPNAQAVPVRVWPGAPRWSGTVEANRPLHLEFGFEDRPQLASYQVSLRAGSDTAHIDWQLERSSDGHLCEPLWVS